MTLGDVPKLKTTLNLAFGEVNSLLTLKDGIPRRNEGFDVEFLEHQGEVEPLLHSMIILYVTVMLAQRLIIVVYFCWRVSMQGLFTGCVGIGNQLGIAGFGAGCILGECLHGNATQFFVCVSAAPFCSFIYLYMSHVTDCIARSKIYKVP